MVIKAQQCDYTEYRVLPGKGKKFVAKDGKVTFLMSRKVDSLFKQRTKAVKLTWTQAWRRHNKKGKTEGHGKKRARRVFRVQRAIAGLSLDQLKEKKAQVPTIRQASKDAAVKAAKAKADKAAQKKAAAPKPAAQKAAAPAPKAQKQKTARR